jgi:predicted outer membrane protein
VNPGPRRWLAVTIAKLAGVAAGALVLPVPGAAEPLDAVTATDMVLLNGVRLAGLWEMPAGHMAAEKGVLPRVREIGAEIARQHGKLDQLVVDAANELGVKLPDQPNADQQTWLEEMRNASGRDFDRVFVDRLRTAHGRIFPVIGAVRAGTRNDVVRKLAQAANGFVLEHMTLLESTGLVRYNDLPPAALPAQQDNSLLARAQANAGAGVNPAVAWSVLIAAIAAGAFVTYQIVSWRGRSRARWDEPG